MRAILPEDILEPEWITRQYRPNCSQYANVRPGTIQTSIDGIITQGNCSPNPPGTPWDFVCYNINGRTRCHASNGRQASSYQQICCPQNLPPNNTRPSCCRGNDFNACALCLDRRQGVTDAASHQRNMVRCRNNCLLF